MISAIPKSGFEVVHPSTNQLVVVAHPAYFFAVITFMMIAIGIFLAIRGFKKADFGKVGIGLFLILLGLFLSSLALSRGRAVFDKNTGQVTFERVGVLFREQRVSFPLTEVRRAIVQTRGGADHFLVVFTDGGTEDLVVSTSAGGQFKAAYAVNEFLGIPQ